jgi:hypothetical protein
VPELCIISGFKRADSGVFFLPLSLDIIIDIAASTAQLKAGDISRRKKVKEKRPSPFLFSAINTRNK